MILKRTSKSLVALSTFLSSFAASLVMAQDQAGDAVKVEAITSQEKHFTLKVLPVLKSKCFGCHGADTDDLKGEFDVRSRESLLLGGESGEPGLVVGDPDASPLVQAVKWEGLEMPPKENDRLNAAQVDALERWVEAGAPWPDATRQQQILAAERLVPENEDGVLMKTSGGLSDQWTYRRYQKSDVWAFQPLSKKFRFNAIDDFVNARLAETNLSPAPQATPRELIRRVTFDLTGLPPTTDQIRQFMKDWETDPEMAWSTLVDRLLESPRYGERWAQHWLDVV